MLRLAIVVAVAVATISLVAAGGHQQARAGSEAGAVEAAADYDLGVVEIPDAGPRGPIPVRIWGTIAVPQGPGPHPVVLVAHGRHDNGCPGDDFDSTVWPCFEVEQRNDLGMRHVVEAIAAGGAIALSPDLNGAYTGGWGEPDDRSRWSAIVDATLAQLEQEASAGGGRFGIELAGRVDLADLGVLAHSRSGLNAVLFARRETAVDSLFLLAPAADNAKLPDLPTAIVLASCDGDIGGEGRRYLKRARRDRDRSEPVVLVTLERANHNYFNRTLSDLGTDDSLGTGLAQCRPRHRISAAAQRRWLDAASADFFAAELLGARPPDWLRRGGKLPDRLYGRSVEIERLRGR